MLLIGFFSVCAAQRFHGGLASVVASTVALAGAGAASRLASALVRAAPARLRPLVKNVAALFAERVDLTSGHDEWDDHDDTAPSRSRAASSHAAGGFGGAYSPRASDAAEGEEEEEEDAEGGRAGGHRESGARRSVSSAAAGSVIISLSRPPSDVALPAGGDGSGGDATKRGAGVADVGLAFRGGTTTAGGPASPSSVVVVSGGGGGGGGAFSAVASAAAATPPALVVGGAPSVASGGRGGGGTPRGVALLSTAAKAMGLTLHIPGSPGAAAAAAKPPLPRFSHAAAAALSALVSPRPPPPPLPSARGGTDVHHGWGERHANGHGHASGHHGGGLPTPRTPRSPTSMADMRLQSMSRARESAALRSARSFAVEGEPVASPQPVAARHSQPRAAAAAAAARHVD